jgi:hypothetical protein
MSIRKIAIIVVAIIGIAVLFGLILLSTATLGDLLRPFLGSFSYLVSLIATIVAINIICCKIIKPVCQVKFRGNTKSDMNK